MNPTSSDHLPGAVLLRLARRLLPDTLAEVLTTAVADFHDELRSVPRGGCRSLWLRVRWYGALGRLLCVTPFALAFLPGRRTAHTSPVRSGGWLLTALIACLFAGTWPFFGTFAIAALATGALLALAMRGWHLRHPSLLRASSLTLNPAFPEINLSAIHVGGDAAGLIFAAGSVIVVLLGLPQLWWYFAGAAVSSVVVACVRSVKRTHREPTQLHLAGRLPHRG